jgi:hypothetical protein
MDVKYATGEVARKGDRVRYQREEGEVEFVVAGRTGDPEMDWFIDEYPEGGVMLLLKSFGRLFLETQFLDEDLEFVSREPQ